MSVSKTSQLSTKIKRLMNAGYPGYCDMEEWCFQAREMEQTIKSQRQQIQELEDELLALRQLALFSSGRVANG